MSRERAKRALIIAGPNGAGKTTFATHFLPREFAVLTFVNADAFASMLSPTAPDRAAGQAGRLMIRAIRSHTARGDDFAFETTLAGRRYAREIPKWQAAGYTVGLIFLQLSSVELALSRVAQRVAAGGHSVPEDVVRRRFIAGRENFESVYKRLVDDWWLYDNADRPGRIIDHGGKR